MVYFDFEAKTWKPLASTTPAIEAENCYCAASAGNNLDVAGFKAGVGQCIYRYNAEGNVWEMQQQHSGVLIDNLCIIDDYMYVVNSNCNQFPQRYSFSKCLWQNVAKISNLGAYPTWVYSSGATVLHSKLYVLYGDIFPSDGRGVQNVGLHCFNPVKNEWVVKARTCKPHFKSSLFVANNRIYVAGRCESDDHNDPPLANPAPVEAYDEENNTWSVVEQKHIPPNNVGAVEIEGKVFFIINKFPVDSGIRIPPGELYPVYLGEWVNLAKIGKTAVLCYLPVKRESLKAE